MKKWAKFFGGKGGKGKVDKKIFGGTLASVRGAGFVDTCIEHLEKNAMTAEGVFRIAGNAQRVDALKTGFESGKRTGFRPEDDLFDVAALLKCYYRELKPEPLLTYDLYEAFIAALQEPGKEKVLVSKLLSLLPVPNLLMLCKLMGFLKKVAAMERKNKMGSRNLAICFSPNLISPRVETMETVIANAMYATSLICLLIDHYDFYFKNISGMVEGGEEDDDEEEEEEEDAEEEEDDPTKKKKSKKQLEKEQKAKDDEALKKRQDKNAKLQASIEEERRRDEEMKKRRQDRRRTMEQQWQSISSSSSIGPSTRTIPEEEREAIRKAREDRKAYIAGKWSNSPSGSRKTLSPEELKAREKEREEREKREKKEKEEQLAIKKEMEKNYKRKNTESMMLQEEQQRAMLAAGKMTVEDFYKMQQKKFNNIKTGQYTYDDLLAWHLELQNLRKRMEEEKKKEGEDGEKSIVSRLVPRSLSSGALKSLVNPRSPSSVRLNSDGSAASPPSPGGSGGGSSISSSKVLTRCSSNVSESLSPRSKRKGSNPPQVATDGSSPSLQSLGFTVTPSPLSSLPSSPSQNRLSLAPSRVPPPAGTKPSQRVKSGPQPTVNPKMGQSTAGTSPTLSLTTPSSLPSDSVLASTSTDPLASDSPPIPKHQAASSLATISSPSLPTAPSSGVFKAKQFGGGTGLSPSPSPTSGGPKPMAKSPSPGRVMSSGPMLPVRNSLAPGALSPTSPIPIGKSPPSPHPTVGKSPPPPSIVTKSSWTRY